MDLSNLVSNGYFENIHDVLLLRDLNDANTQMVISDMRKSLSEKPDGEYEFTILKNGSPVAWNGVINPSRFGKSGDSIICLEGKTPMFTDFRDIASTTYALLTSGKESNSDLSFSLVPVAVTTPDWQFEQMPPTEVATPNKSADEYQPTKSRALIFAIIGGVAGKMIGKTDASAVICAVAGGVAGYYSAKSEHKA